MSKIRHPNLVALLGYSSDGPEPLVVYELMQNGSLHDQLHGRFIALLYVDDPIKVTFVLWHISVALAALRKTFTAQILGPI